MGGPEVLSFADLIRTYLIVGGKRRLVAPIWLPGTRAIRAGGLLVPVQPGDDQPRTGMRTWTEFVRERLA